MRAWKDVAYLAKPKNLDGGFVVNATAGLPFLIEVGDELALVPPRIDLPRRVHVRACDVIDDARGYVWFSEVTDAASAKALVGCHCLMSASLIDEEAFEQPSDLWAGWTVEDESLGLLGSVIEIIDNGPQSLLSVERATAVDDGAIADSEVGSSDPLLIPLVDEFIVDVDVDARRISVSIPAGLLDL